MTTIARSDSQARGACFVAFQRGVWAAGSVKKKRISMMMDVSQSCGVCTFTSSFLDSFCMGESLYHILQELEYILW